MAIRFIDSVGGYSTAQIARKWAILPSDPSFLSVNTTANRRGGNALYIAINSMYAGIGFDSQATWIIGFALKWTSTNAGALVTFMDGAYRQCVIGISATGALTMNRGTVTGYDLLATTAAGVLSTGMWNYIEVKVTIHSSAGSYAVRLNETQVLSGSGAATRNASSSNNSADSLCLGSYPGAVAGAAGLYVHDIYICDGTGGSYDNFLGDRRVDCYLANGAGNSSQFTPSAGSNYQNVDETPADDDTTYNESATVGNIDLYTMADMAHTPVAIDAVQTNLCIGKSDAGTRTVREKCRFSSTTYDGTTVNVPVGYRYLTQLRVLDPTGSAWTKTNFNATEFGVEIVS